MQLHAPPGRGGSGTVFSPDLRAAISAFEKDDLQWGRGWCAKPVEAMELGPLVERIWVLDQCGGGELHEVSEEEFNQPLAAAGASPAASSAVTAVGSSTDVAVRPRAPTGVISVY